jgi:hypothetical protein
VLRARAAAYVAMVEAEEVESLASFAQVHDPRLGRLRLKPQPTGRPSTRAAPRRPPVCSCRSRADRRRSGSALRARAAATPGRAGAGRRSRARARQPPCGVPAKGEADAISDAASGAHFDYRSWRSIGLGASAARTAPRPGAAPAAVRARYRPNPASRNSARTPPSPAAP